MRPTPMTSPVSSAVTAARPRWARHVARVLIVVVAWSNLQVGYHSVAGLHLGPAPAHAAGPAGGPIADPNAALAFRPGLTQASNGVPVVNITTPNAAGLSLNKYQSFNVDSQGLILNNSLQNGNALLGSGVTANPNLTGAGRTAQTIVNEVTVTGAPSMLAGTIETFGAPASVVIANPNGITCSGCGVLNTPRFTLATGTPLLRDSMGLATAFATAQQVDFDVLGGQLLITGRGVEGTVGRIDLLGQTLGVQAPVRAHYLNQDLSSINLSAGVRVVRQLADGSFADVPAAAAGVRAATSPTSVAGAGTPPALAIDASILGAMTAGQIRVISTDEGMGVNLRGPVVANQRDLQISANGTLSLGQVAAVRDITLSSRGDMAIGSDSLPSATAGRTVAAGGRFTAQSQGNLQLQGSVQAVGRVDLAAWQDLRQQGPLDTTASLNVTAGRDTQLGGPLRSGDSMTLQAGRQLGVQGQLQAQNDVQLGASDIQARADITAGHNLGMQAGQTLAQSGKLQAGNLVDLQATGPDGQASVNGSIGARQTQIQAGNVRLGDAQGLNVQGNFQAAATDTLQSRKLTVQGEAQGTTTLYAGRDLTVDGGLSTNQQLNLVARDGTLRTSGAVSAASIAAAGGDVVVDGNLASTGAIALQSDRQMRLGDGGATSVQGATVAAQAGTDLVLQAGTALSATGDASLAAGRSLAVLGSVNAGNIHASAGNQLDMAGHLSTPGTAQLIAGGTLNLSGTVDASDVRMATRALDLSGDLTSAGTVDLKATESVNVGGRVQVGGQLGLTAGTDLRIGGSVQSAGATQLLAGGHVSVGGDVTAGAGVNIQGGANVALGGAVRGSSVTLGAGQNLAVAGDVQASQGLTAFAGQDIVVTGRVDANGPVTAQAGRDLSLLQQASANGAAGMRLEAGRTLQAQGPLQAGALDVNGQQVVLKDAVTVGGAAQLRGGTVQLDQTLQAGGAVTVAASTGDVALRGVRSGGDLNVVAQGNIGMQDAQAQGKLSLTAQTGAIRSGDLAAGQNLTAVAQTQLATGQLSAGGTVDLQATAGNASTGRILAAGDLSARAGQDLAVAGAALAGGRVQATAGGALQIAGSVQSGGNLAGGDLVLSGRSVLLGGDVLSGGAAQLTGNAGDVRVAGSVSAIGATALAGRNVVVQGADGVRSGGSLDMRATAGNLQSAGALRSTGNLNVLAQGGLTVQGDVSAQQGSITTSSGGDTLVQGRLLAGQALDARSGGALQATQVQAGADATLQAGAGIQTQQIQVAGQLQARAGTDLVAHGDVVAGQLQLQAGTGRIQVDGQLATPGGANLAGGADIQVGGAATVLQDASFTSGGAQRFGDAVHVQGGLDMASGQGIAVVRDVQAANHIALDGGSGAVSVGGMLATNGRLALQAQGNITAGASVYADNATVTSLGGAIGLGQAGGSSVIDIAQNLTLQSRGDTVLNGSTTVQGHLAADSSQGSVRFQGPLGVKGDFRATAQNDVVFQGDSSLAGATQIDARTGTVRNQGRMLLGQGLNLNMGGDFSNEGTVEAAGDIRIQARNISSNLAQAGGLLTQGRINLTASGNTTVGAGGVLSASQDITLRNGGTLTTAGQVQSGQALRFDGALYDNSGLTTAGSTVTVNGGLRNQGTLYASTVTVTGNTSNSGQLGGGTVSLSTFDNAGTVSGTTLTAGATSNTGSISGGTVAITGGLANDGFLASGGDLSVTDGDIRNGGSLIGGTVTLRGNTIANTGQIQAAGLLDMSGGTLTNAGSDTLRCDHDDCGVPENVHWTKNTGTVTAQTITGRFTDGIRNSGLIAAAGDIQLEVANGLFTNVREVNLPQNAINAENVPGGAGSASIQAGGKLAIDARDGIANTDGKLLAGDKLTLTTTQGGVISAGALAVISAPRQIDITAKRAVRNTDGAQLLADDKITVTTTGTSTEGSFTNSGIVFGMGGATDKIEIKTAGAINNTSEGILIAKTDLKLDSRSYVNRGTVGSFGDATLTTTTLDTYNPATDALLAKGKLTLATGNVTVQAGQEWASAATEVHLTHLDNYGAVALKGTLYGDVANTASGIVFKDGAPPTDGRYSLPTIPPPVTPDDVGPAILLGYNDVASRATFVAGGLVGSIVNDASDTNVAGTSYQPISRSQEVYWQVQRTDPANPGAPAQWVTVVTQGTGTSEALLNGGPGTLNVNLVGPNTGTIVGDNVTINGGSLTFVDGSSAANAVSQAQNQSAGAANVAGALGIGIAGGVVQAALQMIDGAGSHAGGVVNSPGIDPLTGLPVAGNAANGVEVVSAIGKIRDGAIQGADPSAIVPLGLLTTKPLLVSGAGGTRLDGAALDSLAHIGAATPQSAAALLMADLPSVRFPAWNQTGVVPGGVNANDLQLNLSGSFTNQGNFRVTNNLTINAAGGIDNSGASLRAGGEMQLFGGGLNNRDGVLAANSLFADISGDVLNERGAIQTAGNLGLTTDGKLLTQNGQLTSTGGNLWASAQGDIDATAARIRAAGNARLDAGGTLQLQGQAGAASLGAGGQLQLHSGRDLNIAGMALSGDKGVAIGAGGSIQAREAAIDSAAGSVALDAGADIDLSAARVRGAQGAQVIAGGNILLDARQEVKRNTDQTVASHGVQASELIDWNGGDSPVYKEITVTVKDSTTTTTVDSVRHIGTMLDGGAGDLTVVAGGNVTGRGATLTSQGRTTVQGANVDLRALVDRTTTTTDVVQHAYSDQPAEHSVETKEVLSGGTVQGGHGVTIVAHSDQAGQGNVTLAGVRVNGGAGGVAVTASGNVKAETVTLNQSRTVQKDVLETVTYNAGDYDTPFTYTVKTDTVSETNSKVQQAGTVLDGGKGDVRVIAGADVVLSGSQLRADRNIDVQGINVTLGAKINSTDVQRQTSNSHSEQHVQTAVSTSLNADGGISIKAIGALGADGKPVAGTGDVKMEAAQVQSGGMATVMANHDIVLQDVVTTDSASATTTTRSGNFLRRKTTTETETSTATSSHGTSITAGDLLALSAGGSIGGTNADLTGANGVLATAQGNIVLLEGRETTVQTFDSSKKTSGLGNSFLGLPMPGNSSAKGSVTLDDKTANVGSIRSANGGVKLEAGGLLWLQGEDLSKVAGPVTLQGSEVMVTAASETRSSTDAQSSSGIHIGTNLFSIRPLTTGSRTQVKDDGLSIVNSQLGGSSVSVTATGTEGKGGTITMAGATVNTPGAVTYDFGDNGKLNFGAPVTVANHAGTGTSGNHLYQYNSGAGSSQSTASYNSVTAGGGIVYQGNPNNISVQIGSRASVQELARQPGLEWMGQLANDPRVNWQKVEEASKTWDYHQAGLTQAGAIVVTAVVSFFTYGTGGALVGATEGSAYAAMANAAFSSLASQAAIATINNQGDLGGILHDLGSSATVRGLATAIVTAGALNGLGLSSTAAVQGTPSFSVDGVMRNLGQNLGAATVRALVNTAINGGSLEDNLRSGFLGALVDTGSGAVNNFIGNSTDAGSLANYLAHAVAGCAQGAAQAGSGSGCGAGAIGGVAGEAAANAYNANYDISNGPRPGTTQFSAMVGGIAGAAAGVDPSIASQAGAIAAENNQLSTISRLAQMCKLVPCAFVPTGSAAGQVDAQRRYLEETDPGYATLTPAQQAQRVLDSAVQLFGTTMQMVGGKLVTVLMPGASLMAGVFGNTQPNNTGNNNPAPDYGNSTTTPGTPQTLPGSPGYVGPSQEGGSTVVSGGFGAGAGIVINPATWAVPAGDRNAIDVGLRGGMGGLPTIERPGTNEISSYPGGTQSDAENIFNNLPLHDVKPISSGYGSWGQTGTLPDGTQVTVRPSQDGRPTIQVVDTNRPSGSRSVQEIRFGPKT